MLEAIKLQNFRNYSDFKIKSFSKFNIFLGPNACGKTNLIEAIQLTSQLSSFRHPKINHLINNSINDFARIEVKHNVNKLISNIVMYATESKKIYKLNDKVKSIKDLKGKFPAVCFIPDDLSLIKGSNRLRLMEFDNLGCQLSKSYFTVYKDYNKVIKQKNKMLKNKPDLNTLKSLNDVLVVTGAQLAYFRQELIKKILPLISELYKYEEIDINYISSWGGTDFNVVRSREKLADCLESVQAEELSCKHSVIGPHRDKIKFMLNNLDAGIFASQGQQRSIVLYLKLAELNLLDKTLNNQAILLLDDVMSELDKVHRDDFLELIERASQVFITTTNIDYFSSKFINKSNIYDIKSII